VKVRYKKTRPESDDETTPRGNRFVSDLEPVSNGDEGVWGPGERTRSGETSEIEQVDERSTSDTYACWHSAGTAGTAEVGARLRVNLYERERDTSALASARAGACGNLKPNRSNPF
jgi:hypothetical protein